MIRPPRVDREALQQDQVQSHAEYVPPATAGISVVLVALGVFLWPVVNHATLLAWLSGVAFSFAWRLALAIAYRRRPSRLPLAHWLFWFRSTFALHGLTWAVGSVVLFAPASITDRAFLAFAVAGVTASALNTSAFDLVAAQLVLSVAVAPWSLRMLLEGGRVQTTIGAMLALFLAYLSLMATRIHQNYVRALATRQELAEEAERRRQAETQLRDLNQNLEELVATRTSALQASEARLAQALDTTNDGLWDFDLVTGKVYFSPVYARLLGYQPHEFEHTLEFFWRHVHPDDVERLQQAVGDHIQGRRPAKDIEVRLRTRTGEYRWFFDQGGIAARGPDGSPLRMIGTISDITERKRAEQALHESEARFRALFDKTPVIVALVDLAESRIAEMNEVGLRAFGYTREEVLGRTTIELNMWADEPRRRQAARQLLDTGHVSGLEVTLRRKDGGVFHALLSSAMVSFKGQPFALNTLQDITDRRELEARVLQSQKMEVVGHLAGGIAHDFNNVLTVITSTADLALSGTRPDDPMHEALDTILAASTRAAKLTAQLLAFSRRQILQPAVLDLNELVTGLAPMIRRVLGESIVFDLRPAAQPITVVADRGSLEQVLLNMAINARDAMLQGGTLTIAVGSDTLGPALPGTPGLPAGTYATLTVSDTGSGMSEAVRSRIFEPFFTTKDVGKGTGLGLSVAHGVIAQSGGDIVVHSAPGAGSRFLIYLPRSGETPAAVRLATPALTGGHETVLVVDDDPDVLAVIQKTLRHAGYPVLVASTGDEALEILRQQDGRVDLVLTDVAMPGVSGRELADRVREEYPCVRVLFSSGYAESIIARHGVLAEGVQFLAKPYSLQALTRKVREVLDS